jgi:NAD+ diphosphatase
MTTYTIGAPVTKINGPGWWFVFSGDKLLVDAVGNRADIPFGSGIEKFRLSADRTIYLGTLDNHPCYGARVDKDAVSQNGLEFLWLRGLYSRLSDSVFCGAGRALQMVNWDRTHQYCSRCGNTADTRNEEGAQICLNCGYLSYPRISPAVIVAVLKDEQILLAHNKRFPNKRYSVIAGYVEVGETLEDCVQREIREEVGIEVNNIRYFGSQSWPYSGSLMIAFTAAYASGNITADKTEIMHADWFSADNFPSIPDKDSIARQMIDWFTAGRPVSSGA